MGEAVSGVDVGEEGDEPMLSDLKVLSMSAAAMDVTVSDAVGSADEGGMIGTSIALQSWENVEECQVKWNGPIFWGGVDTLSIPELADHLFKCRSRCHAIKLF